MAVIPSAKAVYLCEETDVEGGETNLYGLFDAIRPRAYPHRHASFICFAQLRGGLGDVPCHIDIRRADDSRLVHVSNRLLLRFPDRDRVAQLAVAIEGCAFETPGVYLIELFCDNVWVADTSLILREVRP